MMAEMADPAEFPRALRNALSVFITAYFIVAIVSYSICGEGVPGIEDGHCYRDYPFASRIE